MNIRLSICLLIIVVFSFDSLAQKQIKALQQEVEVIKDPHGINHIYAQNEDDLFFTQGYLAARDRLFQFEIWRRQATGTLAEILGPRELKRDIGARLFKFRGDKKSELQHYHPRGEQIVDAFVEGINAYITSVREDPEQLPVEFGLLGILPELWTWEVVISRHQGLLQNVIDELNYSRVVSLIGAEKAKSIYYFHPFEPKLSLDPSISQEILLKDIIAPYRAFRSSVTFLPEDVLPAARNHTSQYLEEAKLLAEESQAAERNFDFSIGSNNWVVSGALTESGFPYMANDPHRLHAIPSLRYWVHLHAPGWDVIGGGEPVIPGISIGHNAYGAWGLTIFETDNEDLRIYDINPRNPHQYRHKGAWMDMKLIRDTIAVKGQPDEIVDHFYTVHGPVTFIDESLNKAVAVQCAWLEVGGAPYLASLRMDQSKTWEEFREACSYNHIPAENMVWADRKGNIGWQATGIAPIRRGFSGLVATPGDGSHEWDGYLPILDRPNSLNPSSGIVATSNENVTDKDYPFPEALGYEWADAFRGDRTREVLSAGKKLTLKDMADLQNDYFSIPARQLVPMLPPLEFKTEQSKKAKTLLENWDYVLDKESVAAAIYVMWERKIRDEIKKYAIPEEAAKYISSIQLTRVLQWLAAPGDIFGQSPELERDRFLQETFTSALTALEVKLGDDMSEWQYGQTDYKHAWVRHALSPAVSADWQQKLNAGPVARGGYSFSPSANAYGDNNASGASFRIIVDTGDWEKTLGINTPGQSGNPESPFYKNLFSVWADDKYFNALFDKQKILESAVEHYKFVPEE